MAVSAITRTITRLISEGRDLIHQSDRLQVAFGRNLAEVDALIREHGEKSGYASIRLFIEAEYPDQAKPFYGSSPAYRALQAGRVASVVGDVGDMSVNALVPFHKHNDDPAMLKATFAIAKKSAGRGKWPTTGDSEAAVGSVAGKAGPKKGSAKAANGAKAKAAKAGTTRTATAPSHEVPVREVPGVTGSATKAAVMRLTKVQSACSDAGAFITLATLVAKACDDIGSGNVLAALASMAPEKAAAKAAKATKPTTAPKRTTRTKASA